MRAFLGHPVLALVVALILAAGAALGLLSHPWVGWLLLGTAGLVGVIALVEWQWRRHQEAPSSVARRALAELIAPGESALHWLELSDAHAPRLDYSHSPGDSTTLYLWEKEPLERIAQWQHACEEVIGRVLGESYVRRFQQPDRANLGVRPMPSHLAAGRMSGVWERVALQISWLHREVERSES